MYGWVKKKFDIFAGIQFRRFERNLSSKSVS